MSQRYSSTRLAKELGVDAKLVFLHLQNAGWIQRDGEHWQLTEVGKSAGGEYQQSDKFGQFITWPESMTQHELFKDLLPDWISATRLGQEFSLSGKLANSLLSELGLIERDQRGWMMTAQAEKLGAEQRNSKQGFFVMWPRTIVDNQVIVDAFETVAAKKEAACLDGRKLNNKADQKIANWLYLNHIAFAYQKSIAFSDMTVSFYLPARKIYLEYWGMENISSSLSDKMQRGEKIKRLGLKYIELDDQNLAELDEFLPQKLLQFGLQLY